MVEAVPEKVRAAATAIFEECERIFGSRMNEKVCLAFARVAIAALREPSEAMLDAIPAGFQLEQRELARKHFRMMIDAAQGK